MEQTITKPDAAWRAGAAVARMPGSSRRGWVSFSVTAVLAVLFLLPVMWMVSLSFKPPAEWMAATPTLIPREPTLDNYRLLFVPEHIVGPVSAMTRGTRPALPAFVTSAIVAPIATLAAVSIGFFAAYAVSRFRTRANLILFLVLVTRMFPPVAFAVPLLVYFSWLGLVDTRLGLILMYSAFTVAFAVWMLKGFIDGVPVHLEEAAMLDGASRIRTLFTVTLPLVKGGVLATALFVFILQWTEFLFAFIFSSTKAITLPVQISYYVGAVGTFYGPQAALGVVSSLPVLVIGYLIYRHLVTGFTFGLVRE
jgi:multiple sugar transport system permease protein